MPKRKPKKLAMTPEKLVLDQQADIRKRALQVVGHVRKLLDATEGCIKDGMGFPIYLVDLSDEICALDILAGKHTALEELRHTLQRQTCTS